MRQLFFLLILLPGCWISARAQTISLNGMVVDQQTGQPLPGASIEISRKGMEGDGKETEVAGKGEHKKELHLLAGLNGAFVLHHLAVGQFKISVHYVGYEKYETVIDLGKQEVETIRIGLDAKKTELEKVQISSRHDKGSELSALLSDRRADVIQNSVSARVIELSPDLSVANVTQRISGVSIERSTNGEGQYAIIRGMDKRYIYTLVNGIKIPSPDNKNRYVPLDIFPANLLDRLEIIKTLTPDREGDAIGGSVNMIMKSAPAKFTLKADLAAGFADKFFTGNFTKFDNGPSPDRSPRYTYGPAYEATMNNFPNSAFTYTPRHNPIASVAGLSLGGRLLGDRLGILAAGTFQNNYRNVNTVFFGTETDLNNGSATVTDIETRSYSVQQQRSGIHTKLDYRINSGNTVNLYAGYVNLMKNEFRYATDTNLQLGRVGPGTGRVSNSYRTLHDDQQILNLTLDGEHAITSGFSLDWKAAYSKAIGNRPDEATLNLVTGVSKDPATGALVQAPLNLDGSSDREFTRSTDEDKSGYLNLHYFMPVGDAKFRWQIGGMYRDKSRTASYDDYSLRPDNPSIQVYDGNINHNNFVVFNGEGTATDALNYNASEKVGAAFAMVKMEWQKWEVTGGARYENTDLSWSSNVPVTKDGRTGSITYYDVLPSVNLKYALDKRQTLRLSYYSAISRPNFYEVVPHTGGDPDADYQEIGNPNLKRTTADNFDLRYDFFPRGLGQVLAGIFYKRLNNPIEYALEDVGTNTYYLPDNFGKANNYGFELDLTKYWRWFGIRANYTFTNSDITTPKVKRYSTPAGQSTMLVNQTRPLQGQSMHIGNISLLFKDDNKMGLNAQLALAYTGRRINTVSQYLDNDIWQKGFVQMDFSVEKKLASHWAVYAKVNNILNTPYQLEIRQPFTGGGVSGAVPHQSLGKNVFVRKDTYGANYLLGVKFKF
jgi:outer membrane cobalamin receptor